MTLRTFFGDGEHDFALPAVQLLELERSTGAGIGVLLSRVLAKQFGYLDLTETIRLGLIGGGTAPKEAKRLVTTYGEQRPIAEMIEPAIKILTYAYFGPDADQNALSPTVEAA